MAEASKGLITTNIQSPAHSVKNREDAIPTGWKYKRLKLGPITLPWYASPKSQLILVSFVCFLCPGMYNAFNGFGASEQLSPYASSASNSAIYATFAVAGFFAGPVTNTIGIKNAVSFGSLGYCVYVSSLLHYNFSHEIGYNVFAGLLLGCCAGILWSAQGAIMMSYPPEKLKGRFISWFWIIFNLGCVIGSLVELALNINMSANATLRSSIYVGFLGITFLGACLSWTLVDAKHVVRYDGSRVILMKHPTWKTETIGLWETIWSDPYIILLFPMFFTSNWFYTYQFNDVNLTQFNTRTRALNNTLFWLAQMFGALIFGMGLDFPNTRRTTRAKVAWVVMFVLTFTVWGGGYVFQRKYTREDTALMDHFVYDWTSDGYVGPMFLYICYGFYDAAWQTCVYWFMGAITNNSRKLANFAGFYKGIQSAGAAVIWYLDGFDSPRPYMSLFASCWILLAGSLVTALPVILLKIKDTVPLEEDLKFTDETVEDVIGHKVIYDSPEQDKV
ncbi:MFS general substrate transporter [Mytilinidion resinicola]|uniref:MFS general substrate transporter n=1 Tax=Mytilinidion resinicola TaxID=574789 RepID=A0A6A6Z1P5_9PEZI|nr:MFS general substrate transporter [Mytilinidion resinicola]KAF2814157.1 MFS general substrate transporter [Mytilinidion resinicola]